jgi:hypothetical protein
MSLIGFDPDRPDAVDSQDGRDVYGCGERLDGMAQDVGVTDAATSGGIVRVFSGSSAPSVGETAARDAGLRMQPGEAKMRHRSLPVPAVVRSRSAASGPGAGMAFPIGALT